mmetsp:Transcript_54752/g.146304  ORF Transcript_54752/g.146304 Transcript_54752/m.146304 type:complete len:418 (+) Transcript_54752:1005-2258(+)
MQTNILVVPSRANLARHTSRRPRHRAQPGRARRAFRGKHRCCRRVAERALRAGPALHGHQLPQRLIRKSARGAPVSHTPSRSREPRSSGRGCFRHHRIARPILEHLPVHRKTPGILTESIEANDTEYRLIIHIPHGVPDSIPTLRKRLVHHGITVLLQAERDRQCRCHACRGLSAWIAGIPLLPHLDHLLIPAEKWVVKPHAGMILVPTVVVHSLIQPQDLGLVLICPLVPVHARGRIHRRQVERELVRELRPLHRRLRTLRAADPGGDHVGVSPLRSHILDDSGPHCCHPFVNLAAVQVHVGLRLHRPFIDLVHAGIRCHVHLPPVLVILLLVPAPALVVDQPTGPGHIGPPLTPCFCGADSPDTKLTSPFPSSDTGNHQKLPGHSSNEHTSLQPEIRGMSNDTTRVPRIRPMHAE